MRRRLLLAGLGGLSGLLAGVGVSLVIDQSGRLAVGQFFSISLVSVLVGVALAVVRLPRRLNTASSIAAIGLIVLTPFVGVAPARAQSGCELDITSEAGDTSSLLETSATEPFVVDLSTPRTFDVQVVTPVGSGIVEVTAKRIEGTGPLVTLPDTVLWYGAVEGGGATTNLRFERRGATGAEVAVAGLPEPVPILPWGTLQLELNVDRVNGSARAPACTATYPQSELPRQLDVTVSYQLNVFEPVELHLDLLAESQSQLLPQTTFAASHATLREDVGRAVMSATLDGCSVFVNGIELVPNLFTRDRDGLALTDAAYRASTEFYWLGYSCIG